MSSSQTNILAIETSTSACSVALSEGGKKFSRFEIGSNIHSGVLLTMIDSVLQESSLSIEHLDAVAVGQGPGSFTGLRIGVGVGQGLAFGARCPMVAVPSLDALAYSAQGYDGCVMAGIDARMGEIYWAEYSLEADVLTRIGPMRVSLPGDVCTQTAVSIAVGNAWAEYREQLPQGFLTSAKIDAEKVYPSAVDVLSLARIKHEAGECCAAVDFVPIYVRNDVAKKSSKPLPGKRPAT